VYGRGKVKVARSLAITITENTYLALAICQVMLDHLFEARFMRFQKKKLALLKDQINDE
jgi:hypothetical protein